MTQTERLYDYLITHKSINPLQSWAELGIYRLSARIHDLNKDHRIEREMVTVTNKYGESIKVAEYWLECDCPTCSQEKEQCKH